MGSSRACYLSSNPSPLAERGKKFRLLRETTSKRFIRQLSDSKRLISAAGVLSIIAMLEWAATINLQRNQGKILVSRA